MQLNRLRIKLKVVREDDGVDLLGIFGQSLGTTRGALLVRCVVQV